MIIVWLKRAFFVPNSTKKHTARIEYRDKKNTKSSQTQERLVRNKNRKNDRFICNKIHSKHRILTTEQGKFKAKEYGFHYFETSSLDKNTIDNLFQYIIEKIDESRKNEKIELEKHYDNYHIFPKRDNLGKRPKNRCCQIL